MRNVWRAVVSAASGTQGVCGAFTGVYRAFTPFTGQVCGTVRETARPAQAALEAQAQTGLLLATPLVALLAVRTILQCPHRSLAPAVALLLLLLLPRGKRPLLIITFASFAAIPTPRHTRSHLPAHAPSSTSTLTLIIPSVPLASPQTLRTNIASSTAKPFPSLFTQKSKSSSHQVPSTTNRYHDHNLTWTATSACARQIPSSRETCKPHVHHISDPRLIPQTSIPQRLPGPGPAQASSPSQPRMPTRPVSPPTTNPLPALR